MTQFHRLASMLLFLCFTLLLGNSNSCGPVKEPLDSTTAQQVEKITNDEIIAQIQIVPNTPYTDIINTTVTAASKAQMDSLRLPSLTVERRGANIFVIDGALALDAKPRTFERTVTAEGEEIVFSMMMQHFLGSASGVRRVQDQIGVEISGLRRGAVERVSSK